MGLAHQSLVSPCRSFFPFSLLFSLCSSFRMTPWNKGALLAFCVNQGRSSLFFFPFYFPYRLGCHPEGTPGSCWGCTPVLQYANYHYYVCQLQIGISTSTRIKSRAAPPADLLHFLKRVQGEEQN